MAVGVDVNDRDVVTEEVWLGGEGPYTFTYPKMSRIMNAQVAIRGMAKSEAESVMLDAIVTWLERGFGPEAWTHIQSRLDDESDGLEMEPHLVEVFRRLVQAHAGRPTTSSNGASAQPWMKTGTGVPSQPESDSENSTLENSAT